jgi:hypothetical protein
MIRFLYKQARTWVRPSWFIPLFLATYLAFEGPYAWWVWWRKIPLGQEILRARDGMMLVMCGVFGALRAGSLHPLIWINYGRWLARTPWQAHKPLPLGPLHLTLRDGVLLTAVVLLLHDANVSLLRVPVVFFMSYSIVLCWILATTECKEFAYAIAFGLGLVVRLWSDPQDAACVAAALYPLSYAGLRRSLAGFPWSKPFLVSVSEPKIASPFENKWLKLEQPVQLGWPFDIIRPRLVPLGITYADGILVSLLLGWWLYCVVANPMDLALREFILFLASASTLGAAITRLFLYCQNYRPPINTS